MSAQHESGDDLGFRCRKSKNGDVVISRDAKTVTTLRGVDANDFLEEAQGADLFSQQQLMARVTGNYKRGNESVAINHPRNRR